MCMRVWSRHEVQTTLDWFTIGPFTLVVFGPCLIVLSSTHYQVTSCAADASDGNVGCIQRH